MAVNPDKKLRKKPELYEALIKAVCQHADPKSFSLITDFKLKFAVLVAAQREKPVIGLPCLRPVLAAFIGLAQRELPRR